MKELTTSGQWRELQTKLKIKYPELTETGIEYQEMQQDILHLVEYKPGKSKEEMKEIIAGS